MAWKTTRTLPGSTANPFLSIHSKRVQRTSVNYEHCHFFFLEGGKTFVLAMLLQFQEVVLIPRVSGIETIINLEGFCLWGEGLLGWGKKIPLVLSGWAVSLGGPLSSQVLKGNGISCMDGRNCCRAQSQCFWTPPLPDPHSRFSCFPGASPWSQDPPPRPPFR